MHSPKIEWTAFAAHLILVDYVRDRGEPDGDTASEVLRAAFRVERPEGRAALAAAITIGAVGLYAHLTKRDMREHHLRKP